MSYIAVLTAGALPAYFYVGYRLEDQILSREISSMQARAFAIAPHLARQKESDAQAVLTEIAKTSELRITGIRADGAVFFEGGAPNEKQMVSHADRPEVQQALTGMATTRHAFDPEVSGIGVDRRVSATLKQDLVYLALTVPSKQDNRPYVLRLASSTRSAKEITARVESFLRTALAFSLSVALFLTLLAAAVLVRPLTRLRDAMVRISEGDFGPVAIVPTNDELGDVGRALEDLTRRVRTRIAVAGGSDAIMTQLVEVLREPIAIATANGQLVTLNGAARRYLAKDGVVRDVEIGALFASKRVKQAALKSEEMSEPVLVEMKEHRSMYVAVLKRPSAEPLFMLFAPDVGETAHRLPDSSSVTVRPLDEILNEARDEAAPALAAAQVIMRFPDELPAISLVDADDRVSRAVGRLFAAAAWATGTRPGVVELRVEAEANRVRLAIDATTTMRGVDEIVSLLEPIGGAAEADGDEVRVWLPRA